MADSVAQLVEHYTFNVGVLGSSPSGITKRLRNRALFLFVAGMSIEANFKTTMSVPASRRSFPT